MVSADPFHGLAHMLEAVRESGFDAEYVSPDLTAGLSSHGPVTVLMGGMPIGELVRDHESGRWRFRSGEPNLPYLSVRPARRETAPAEAFEPAAFEARCTAWTHDPAGTARGYWIGPMRDTYDLALHDAQSHEHAEAFVAKLQL